jgi:hypothetical protein
MTITAHQLPQCDGRVGPALAGGAEGGETSAFASADVGIRQPDQVRHIGCFELFAREGIRSIPDLKGKTVGVQSVGSPAHLFVSTMAAHVGLDPRKDIRWVAEASPKPMELFAAGQIDAFLGFPPEPQDLRGRGIGRVIVNSVIDRPWSQYFCCMVATHGRAKDCSTSSSYPMMEDAMGRRRLEKRTLIRSLSPIAIL